MRLDGVEVKVSLDGDQTAAAVRALDLADGAPWKIFFAEDVTTGLCSATPLLDQHLIVRARQKTTGKKGKDLFMPLRLALTGQQHGPELANLMPIWGPHEVKSRLETAVSC